MTEILPPSHDAARRHYVLKA